MNSMKRAIFGSKSNSKGEKIRIRGTLTKDKNDDASAKGSIKGDGSVCDDVQSVVSKHDAQSLISRQDAEEIRNLSANPQASLTKLDSKKKKKNAASASVSETTEVRVDDETQSRISVPKTGKNKKKEGGKHIKSVTEKVVVIPIKPKLPADYYTSIIVKISLPVRKQNRFIELMTCN